MPWICFTSRSSSAARICNYNVIAQRSLNINLQDKRVSLDSSLAQLGIPCLTRWHASGSIPPSWRLSARRHVGQQPGKTTPWSRQQIDVTEFVRLPKLIGENSGLNPHRRYDHKQAKILGLHLLFLKGQGTSPTVLHQTRNVSHSTRFGWPAWTGGDACSAQTIPRIPRPR